MKDKQFQRWKETRTRGRGRYILANGVFAWGLPMFIVMTFIVSKSASDNLSISMIILNALIWAASGFGFGYFTWLAWEHAYKKELQRRESKSESNSRSRGCADY